jgi:hypothetical protein
MLLLIGQYDSLFVRRIAIAMRVYGLTFELAQPFGVTPPKPASQ